MYQFEGGDILTEKFLRNQLFHLSSFLDETTIETARKGQNLLGDLMTAVNRIGNKFEERDMGDFSCEWITPKNASRSGVILYLHGGGYTCGGLDYARGYGSVLASKLNLRVLCVAYRLAPENPFPAAVSDAYTAYLYLLQNGFLPENIILAGESAGGGLCYSLCVKLAGLGMKMPAGIIAVSPWTDLTQSGESHNYNKEKEPSLTKEKLDYYAQCYAPDDKRNPLASPLFSECVAFPPSLIFVGGDEILLDDSVSMHKKLIDFGCRSELVVAPRMWHVYPLYGVKEYDKQTSGKMKIFVASVLPDSNLRWLRLDNAAKIFPASKRRGWYNIFRQSCTLSEPVDREVLQSALDITVRRFPSIAVRLRRGAFWYYLEELEKAPEVMPDGYQPLMRRPFDDVRKCAVRVLYYNNRIAVEFFHAVTDGTGGMVFLKTLVAEYVSQKYGVNVSDTCGVLDRYEFPKEEELEDSFLINTGLVARQRKEERAYQLPGVPENDGFFNLTCGILDADKVLALAHEYGVTVTALLAGAMISSILTLQKQKVPKLKKRMPVKVSIPINLRRLYGSKTMRNFVMVTNVGVDPKMGDYEFKEICEIVSHQMALTVTPKYMRSVFTTNVNSEKGLAIKLVPLFIKNIIMKAVFDAIGECQACLSMSNLGVVAVPDEMKPYVERFDFIIGPQSKSHHNCGIVTYGGKLYINMIRRSCDPELEREFYTTLVKLGLNVKIESNQRRDD